MYISGLRKESRANDDPRIVLLEQCVQKWNLQIELWCFFTFCNANANFALAHRLGNLSGARENRRKLCSGYWSGKITLKIANSSLTDHYIALELVQYLNFKLGILTTLTNNHKYKLTLHTTVPKLSTNIRTEAEVHSNKN